MNTRYKWDGTIACLREIKGIFRREGPEEQLASRCALGTQWKTQGDLEHSL